VSPSDLPRSVVRGRVVVIALLVVSTVVGLCGLIAIVLLLVPMLLEAIP
jgi:hypothetical protein